MRKGILLIVFLLGCVPVFSGNARAAVPYVSSVSPNSGSTSGGREITITGTGFTGALSVTFGGNPGTNLQVISDTEIKVTTPPGAAGEATVVVTTPDGSGTWMTNNFHYFGPPSITSLTPQYGLTSGGTQVTLFGSGFQNATSVTFGGIPGTSVSPLGDTLLMVNTPPGTSGAVDVVVTSAYGTSSGGPQFTYVDHLPPTVSYLDVASGPESGGTTIIIRGTEFTNVSDVSIAGVPVTSYHVDSDTQITAVTAASTMSGEVTVTTLGGTSSGGPQFTYYLITPHVSSFAPLFGSEQGGTTVVITGQYFTGASAVTIGGYAAASFTVDSDTQITAVTAAGNGSGQVHITTPYGTSNTGSFFSYATPTDATVTATYPTKGTELGGDEILIFGTGFSDTIGVTIGGVAAASYRVESDTTILAVTAPGSGSGEVTVTTSQSTSSGGPTFSYINPSTLSVITVTPPMGRESGGTTITITGTAFTGATAVTIGGVAAASFTVDFDTQITAVTAAGTGNGEVVVTTSGGTSSDGPKFFYIAAPTVTSVNPTSGPESGGTTVVITGTGFRNMTDISDVSIGGSGVIQYRIDSDTQITAVTNTGSGSGEVIVTTEFGTSSGGPTFTYSASTTSPTVTSVSPNHGPEAGGTTIVITGTGFVNVSAVRIANVAVTSYNVDSSTQITAVTEAGTGSGEVIVTTPNGTSSGGPTFIYSASILPPTVTFVSPDHGSELGGTSIFIRGSNFTGTTGVSIAGQAVTKYSVQFGDTISCTTPAGTGSGEVVVTGPNGTSSGGATYTYTAPVAPIVGSLYPDNGTESGGTDIEIYGEYFTGATAVSIAGYAVTNFTVSNDKTIYAQTPPGTGAGEVVVTAPGGTSSGGATYTYTAPIIPVLTGVFPTSGTKFGGTSILIFGEGLAGATAVTIGGIPVASFTHRSNTQLAAVTAADVGTGGGEVIVTTPGGTNASGPIFAYIDPPVPYVASLDVNTGTELGGTTVVITGTGLTGASTVSIAGVAAASYTVDSDTQITAVTDAGTGSGDVIVITPGGTNSGGPQFTYTSPPVPSVTGLNITRGSELGGTTIIITGTGFTGASAVSFASVAAASYNVDSDMQITAVTAAGTGSGDVVVATPFGTSSGGPQFTYAPLPTVTALDVLRGPESGGTIIAVTGTGFTGASAVSIAGITADSFHVDSDTQITAVAAAGTGSGYVAVTTAFGTSSGGPQFSYIPAPAVTGLDVVSGPESGGTTITVTGTNFTEANAVSFAGVAATSYNVDSDTKITAVTAAGTGSGDVVVTTPFGTSSGGPQFTYVAAPTVTTLDVSSGTELGGTTVVITGTGFVNVSAVSIASVAVTSYNVDSSTQITAVTGAGTGSGDVAVTTPGGTSSGGPQFTYAPLPTVTALDVLRGPESGGTTIVVIGTGFTGASAVSIAGVAATSFNVDSDTKITAVTAAGTGSGDVVVTTSLGTSSGGPQFTYAPVPTVTALDVISGPESGNTTVVITGTGFTEASAVSFAGVAATSYNVDSDTRITAVTAAGTGSGVVLVTTPGGTSSGGPSFTYAPVPTVTALGVNRGPESGNTTVVITGTGLTGASAVSIASVAVTSYTVDTDTQITAVTAPGTGSGDVVVTTPGGSSSGGPQFTYVAAPSVSNFAPLSGTTLGGTTVVVTGSKFTGASTVSIAGVAAASYNIDSDTQITAVTAPGTGTGIVAVTTVGGTSSGGPSFTYTAPSVPTITNLNPTSGTIFGGTTVVITGTGFTGATAVNIAGSVASSFTVDSDTQITAVTTAGSGSGDVAVTTPGGTSSGGMQFNYVAPAVPAVTGLNPASGTMYGGTTVVITGTGFTGASAVNIAGSAAASFSVDSDTQITAVTAAGSGSGDVAITTPGGTSSGGTQFSYIAPPTPAVTGLNPTSGTSFGGTTVVVTGTGFTGATVVNIAGSAAASFTVNSDTQITAVTTAGSGSGDVAVTTPGGTSSGGPQFSYVAPAVPTVTSLNPASGTMYGGTTVVITGTGFTGASAVNIAGSAAASFTVNSDTQITAVTTAGSGSGDAAVTTPGGTSSGGMQFTYVAPAAPAVTGLSPTSGAAGTTVVITGSGFTGATAVSIGGVFAASFTVNSDTRITAVTAAGTGSGDVVVTTPGGSSSGGPQFFYPISLAPVVTGLNPPGGAAAGGTTVVITGSGFTGATAVRFAGVAAASFTVNSDTQITAVTAAGFGAGSVAITTSSGTSSGGPQFFYTELRPDPSKDPEVRGLMNAQVSATERHYRVFATNLDTRFSAIRGEGSMDFRNDSFSFQLKLPNYRGMSQRERFFAENTPTKGLQTTSLGSINLADFRRSGVSSDTANAMFSPIKKKRWAAWLDGALSFGTNNNDIDLEHSTLGVSFGVDYAFSDRFVSGFALGYSSDSTDVGNNGTTSESDSYTLALYGSYAVSRSMYFQGAIGYSYIDLESKRHTSTGFARGNRDGSQYFASILLGWDKPLLEKLTLSPYARLEAVNTRLDEFRERGSQDPLKYGKADVETYAGSLGMKLRYSIPTEWGCFTPSAGVEYTYNLKDSARMALGYADTGVMPYSLTADSVARNTFTTTLGIDARVRRNMGVSLNYRGSFANRRDSHTFNLQFNLNW